MCKNCESGIHEIAPKMFQINSRYIMSVYAVSRYTDPLRSMIFAKYYQDQGLIEKVADLMWEKSILAHIQVDCFVPIPLHWTRKFKRGFNQAQVIANRLSEHKKIPTYLLLKRVRMTEYQARIEHSKRKDNVKNAFELYNDYKIDLEGKHIMLVDDFCTTGATALEAAKVLLALKPASINLIVACRSM